MKGDGVDGGNMKLLTTLSLMVMNLERVTKPQRQRATQIGIDKNQLQNTGVGRGRGIFNNRP